MTKQLAFLVAGLALVLMLAGQLARAAVPKAAVPNDSNPYWSWDARTVAFQQETSGGRTARVGGNDTISAGPGANAVFSAGGGNDRIEARDGFRDVINCGAGDDTAEVHRLDVVRGCEHVLRP